MKRYKKELAMQFSIRLKTLTYAIKARKLLSRKGIYSTVIKFTSNSIGGCGYGLRVYNCEQFELAAIIREAGIEYSML